MYVTTADKFHICLEHEIVDLQSFLPCFNIVTMYLCRVCMASTFKESKCLADHGSIDHMICKFDCIILLDNTIVSCLRMHYIVIKFCSCNSTSNFNIYLWNGVLLFGQPLHNHHTRLSQPCTKCHNLVTTLLGCSKVATMYV